MIMADKIIDLRKRNGWTQSGLAARLGVNLQAISKWESAQSVPDLKNILELAQLFEVSTDYLIRDDISAEDEGPRSPAPDTSSETPETSEITAQKAYWLIILAVFLAWFFIFGAWHMIGFSGLLTGSCSLSTGWC